MLVGVTGCGCSHGRNDMTQEEREQKTLPKSLLYRAIHPSQWRCRRVVVFVEKTGVNFVVVVVD